MVKQLEHPQEKDHEEQDEVRPLTLGTNCKECIFFEDPKNCRLGKIDKLEKQGAFFEDRGDELMVDRVCNFRRTEDWQEDRSIEECMEIANQEVKIRGSIVVYSKNIEELDKCISKLSNIKHIENFKIIVTHHSELLVKEVYNYIQDQDHFEEIVGVGVNEAETHTGEIHFSDEAFKRAKNGFIFTIDSSKDFDENILDKVNHFVYGEMGRLLYVPATEEFNTTVVMAVIYEFLKGNRFHDFAEKLQALAQHQALASQITSWDKINEKYIN